MAKMPTAIERKIPEQGEQAASAKGADKRRKTLRQEILENVDKDGAFWFGLILGVFPTIIFMAMLLSFAYSRKYEDLVEKLEHRLEIKLSDSAKP